MLKRYCVVIPTYKKHDALTDDEIICLKSIYDNYPLEKIFFVAPNYLDMNGYNVLNEKHIFRNDDSYFKDLHSYSELMVTSSFYEHFKRFDFMLIHQLDAYTIKNRIDYFMNLGYDYYGAPWKKKRWNNHRKMCGNGGFSLRNIKKMIDFCNKCPYDGHTYEDNFICVLHENDNDLNICPLEIGWEFSFESLFPDDAEHHLPMGCHKLWKYNKSLWNKIKNKEL